MIVDAVALVLPLARLVLPLARHLVPPMARSVLPPARSVWVFKYSQLYRIQLTRGGSGSQLRLSINGAAIGALSAASGALVVDLYVGISNNAFRFCCKPKNNLIDLVGELLRLGAIVWLISGCHSAALPTVQS